jgi:GNAT superfamily N-acetyltransferase
VSSRSASALLDAALAVPFDPEEEDRRQLALARGEQWDAGPVAPTDLNIAPEPAFVPDPLVQAADAAFLQQAAGGLEQGLEPPLPQEDEPLPPVMPPGAGSMGQGAGAGGAPQGAPARRSAAALLANIPEAPVNVEGQSILGQIGNAFKRGWTMGDLAREMEAPAPNAERVMALQQEMQKLPPSPEYVTTMRDDVAPTESWQAFKSNPVGVLGELMGESLAAFGNQMIEKAPNRVAIGLGAGAAMGAPLAGIGAVPGGFTGAGAGFAQASGAASYALEMSSGILEGLERAGVPMDDPAAMRAALADPERMQLAREFAQRKAVPIAIFDGGSALIAGRLGGQPASALAKVGQGFAETFLQGAMGAAGEASGQLAQSGEIRSGRAILAEGVAEVPTGLAEIGVGAFTQNAADANRPEAAAAAAGVKRSASAVLDAAVPDTAPNAGPTAPVRRVVVEQDDVFGEATTAVVDEPVAAAAAPMGDERFAPAPAAQTARNESLVNLHQTTLARVNDLTDSAPLVMAYRSPAQMTEAVMAQTKEATPESIQSLHRSRIESALGASSPVNAEAVDTYGITLPPKYVKVGDVYAPSDKAALFEQPAQRTAGPAVPTGETVAVNDDAERTQHQQQWDALREQWAQQGVTIRPSARARRQGGSVRPMEVSVPQGQRGQGIGTQVMQSMVDLADAQGRTLVLTPSTDFGGSSVSRLKTFYKRFGFVENKGRNKDYSISETMYRPAKTEAANAPGAKAGKSRARIKKMTSQSGAVDVSILEDIVEYGQTVYRAGMDLATWSAQMVKEFGQGVAQFLRQAFDRIVAAYRDSRFADTTGAVGDVRPRQTKPRQLEEKAMRNEALAAETRARLGSEYLPISLNAQAEAAKEWINTNGLDAAKLRIAQLSGEDSVPTPLDFAIGIEAAGRLSAVGDHQGAADIVSTMSHRATGMGQTISTLAMMARLSPEGIVFYGENIIKRYINALPPEAQERIRALQAEVARLKAELA